MRLNAGEHALNRVNLAAAPSIDLTANVGGLP